MPQTWSPAEYLRNAGFVPALGAGVFARLAPKAGERILDLGCGDGTLTQQIVDAGATVVGVDASPEMVAAARARGLDARQMNATELRFDSEFDAVFSNAVLHWVHDADAAIDGVYRALKPGGRFVGEMGGHTNVAAISTAMRVVLARHHISSSWPWYYPSAEEYRARLEARGFNIEDLVLFPRPTPLPTGMEGWLRTFAGALFANISAEQRAAIEAEIVELLRPALCDRAGRWTADYVRLQFIGVRPR